MGFLHAGYIYIFFHNYKFKDEFPQISMYMNLSVDESNINMR